MEAAGAAGASAREGHAPKRTKSSASRPAICIPADVQLAVQNPKHSGSLSDVVSNAVKRWYYEAVEEACRGDVKMQALLGNMLMEGYGGPKDPDLGKEWNDRARRKGYRMAGVYCTI